jgi:glycosyltransferase involved in cell wall biosynthesis
MNNVIFIGKYSFNENIKSAGSKRVLNQIQYLKDYYSILSITFSPQKSEYDFNVNYYTKYHKNVIDLLRYPFYWFNIFLILIKRKTEKNYFILESVVELHSAIPVLFAKILGYRIIHDIVEDFSVQNDTLFINQKITSRVSQWFQKRIKKYCSGIIVISENLLVKFKQTQLPIIKLYNSVPSQSKVDINRKPSKFILFYSGSYGSKDGVLDLIDGFEKANLKRKDIELFLVGSGYGDYFEACLKKIDGNEQIRYFGYVTEGRMFELLTASNILCVTRTNSEFANNGFPFKLAEYMSFGVPVLTTTVSDIPLILKNEDTVFFADPDSSESIAEKINLIIENYSNAIKIGENGKIFCEKEFSIECIGNKLKEFIGKI